MIKGGTIKKNGQAEQLKLQGNAFFLSLEYDKAIDCYDRCFEHIDDSDHTLKTVVLSNKAQCYIKLKKYRKAFEEAD